MKRMNFVTLKELKKMVPAVEEGKRPPSLKKILEEDTEVVLRKLMENHAEVVVYKNGYVSYQAHERSTVFPIHDCKHYHYESQGNEQQTIPHDHFEDMKWHIRLVIEGEDRLAHNTSSRESEVFSYSEDIGFYAVGVFLAGRKTEIAGRKIGTGIAAIVLIAVNFLLSYLTLTTGIMWFVTTLNGVAAAILISQFIKENKILQYFGRISLIVLCIHGPVYRIVVKVVSIPLHMGTDAVRDNFLLAMIVVAVTMFICSVAYEVVMRIAPWMVGKKKEKTF